MSCFCKRKTLLEGENWFVQAGSILESQINGIVESINAKDILEKLDTILNYICNKTTRLFQKIEIKQSDIYNFYCHDKDELSNCISYLGPADLPKNTKKWRRKGLSLKAH